MTTLIFGHKNPDTDTITSAIALSYLKNELGEKTKPVRLGEINKETEFVLNKFGVKSPELVNDVRIQVSDLVYDKVDTALPSESIESCKDKINNDETALLAITNDENELLGVVNLKDMAIGMLKKEFVTIDTSIENIASILDGEIVGKSKAHVSGNVRVVSGLDGDLDLDTTSVLITSDEAVLKAAVEKNAELVILTDDRAVSKEAAEMAKASCIVKTKLDIFTVARMIDRCNYVSTVMNEDVIKFYEDEYIDDVKEVVLETKRRAFPVVDRENRLKGIISKNHIINPSKKNVILVDHNEYAQSANGIEQANIVEVVDHHKIGGLATSNPITFRNMAVGSSCTVVYGMFKENSVEIPKEIAGLLMSGIVSDTLIMRSPTTTDVDVKAIEDLNSILDLDVKEYGMDMFKAGTSLEGFTIEEIFYRDFKEFSLDGNKVGIGQVFTLDIDEIMANKDAYLDFIRKTHEEKGYYITILALTDIIEEGSYILYASNNDKIVPRAFKVEDEQGVFVEGLVSRKKQIVPNVTEAFNIYG